MIFTSNLANKRYKERKEIDPALARRLVSVEVHYHDINKEVDVLDSRTGQVVGTRLAAPETFDIIKAGIADRNDVVDWQEGDPEKCENDFQTFLLACRRIQEDFTYNIRHGSNNSSAARSGRLALKVNVITIEDQMRIVRVWEQGGFAEPLERIILREFFYQKQLGQDYDTDNAIMLEVFVAQGLFASLTNEDMEEMRKKYPSLYELVSKKDWLPKPE